MGQIMKFVFAGAAVILGVSPVALMAQDLGWRYDVRSHDWTEDTSVAPPDEQFQSGLFPNDPIADPSRAVSEVFEARRGNMGAVAQLAYTDLAGSENIAFDAGFAAAPADLSTTMLNVHTALHAHDPYTGVSLPPEAPHVVHATEISFESDPDRALALGGEADGATPVLVLRLSTDFNDKWYGTTLADARQSWDGLDETWQALAMVGYRLSPRWSAEFGYPYMQMAADIGADTLELDLSAPVIGINARF